MVTAAQKYGVSEVARLFERFEAEGLDGLKDRSRPQSSPNRLDEGIRDKIIGLKEKMPHCGADTMISEFGVKASTKTIQKVFREEGLVRPKKSKRSKQRDLRTWKEANFKPLEYWQVDTKDCVHVP